MKSRPCHRYPIQLVRSAIEKASSKNWDDLLKPKNAATSKKKNIIPFIITHNPFNPQIGKILLKYRRILEISEELKPILESKTLVVYKRDTNLKQLLVRADTEPPSQTKAAHPSENHAQHALSWRKQNT